MRRRQARSLLVHVPALLVLAACTPTAPEPSAAKTAGAPTASSVTSPTRSICTPEQATITWSLVSKKKTLTNVFVRHGSPASKTTLVHREDAVQPTISGTPLLTAWIPTLADSLFASKGVSVQTQPIPGDEAEEAKTTLLANTQSGTVVAYSGIEKVEASFTVSCPGTESTPMSGTFTSGVITTTGILHCSINPPASTFGHLARQYCEASR